jgi:hypothetical protein
MFKKPEVDETFNHLHTIKYYGGMAEWLKAAVLKTVRGESSSRVRIPLPPPSRASTRPVAKTSIGLDKKLVSKNSTYWVEFFDYSVQ